MPPPGTHMNLPVDELILDKSNPRIRKWIEMYGDEPTPDQVFMALGAGANDPGSEAGPTFASLKESIRTNGGVIQPVFVNKTPEGQYIVIEGNTRVAIYKDFARDRTPGNWTEIQAIVYENLDEEQIDAIRLQAHLVGPRAWDPYSKAKYLHHLRTKEHFPFDRLVDYCGGRKREVQQLIAGYTDMEQYYRPVLPDDSAFDTTRFSGFVELQRPKIKEAILQAGFTFTDFANWIKDRKIDPLSTVRQLPQILRTPRARQVFLDAGAREALKEIERPDLDTFLRQANISQLCHALSLSIKSMPYQEFQRLKSNPDGDEAQALQDVLGELQDVCDDIFAE